MKKLIFCKCGNSFVSNKWIRLENKTYEFFKIIYEASGGKELMVDFSVQCPFCERGHA